MSSFFINKWFYFSRYIDMKNVMLLVCIIAMVVYCGKSRAQTSKPNFIFFITDDIGWDDLGCYGNPNVKTPNIDSLA